jgi:ABC-2 type transport system permease protein
MTKVWTITQHEVFVTIRRTGYLFMTFGVPIIAAIAVVAYIPLRGSQTEGSTPNPLDTVPSKPIGYVDYSGLFGPRADMASVFVPFPNENSAKSALKRGELSAYYIIASDYMQTGSITRKAPQLGFMGPDTGLFRAFLILHLLNDEAPHLLQRLYEPAQVIAHQLDANGAELSQVNVEERYSSSLVLVYGFSMILVMATILPAGYLLRSIVEEKENRTIEVVLSSSSPIQLLAGKVLGQGTMGLFQVVIWLVSGWALFSLAAGEVPTLQGAEFSLNKILIVLLYFLCGFLLLACFQAGLGAVSTNMREGPQYAAFLTLPMMMPLWLLSVFIEAPNGNLAVILSLIPITAPLSMVQRIAITVVPLWQLVFSLALLVLGILVSLRLSAKIFRVHTLLSGTLPTPAQLLRLLREE